VRILLVRPAGDNERFGLGPFFKVEPLGLEYVAAALRAAGHEVRIADLRYSAPLGRLLGRLRPALLGVSCTHTVDLTATLAVVRQAKRRLPGLFTVVGGHAAATYPHPLLVADVDAVCLGDGERILVELAAALERREELGRVPGLLLREGGDADGARFRSTPAAERVCLDGVPLPARDLVQDTQRRYLCVHRMPLWALETARGCPYRCSFCSVWRYQERSFRLRGIDAVAQDFAATGPNLFVIDDLFFQPRARSLELARELRRRGVKKDWILVQARLDTVARSGEVLRAWRPLAERFDVFFGFEAPTDAGLGAVSKDMSLRAVEEGIGVARQQDFGVTGNFLVDPDWDEADFEALWAMVDRLRLDRAGYTVLTPLPGTPLFDASRHRIRESHWSHWDMHHVLWEPRLGRERFFTLFVETWRRNVLSPQRSRSKLWRWARGLTPAQLLLLGRVLLHTRRLLHVPSYLAETFPPSAPAAALSGRLPLQAPAAFSEELGER
jgi:radical SAM superfamily enzyme YgiQ (UPF0313 family)